MKNIRIALFVLSTVLLMLVAPSYLIAGPFTQMDDGDGRAVSTDSPYGEAEIPTFEGGSPYQYPFISTPARERILYPASPDQATINLWYGTNQTFGQQGISQMWANILGNVSSPSPITSLTYSLNGGEEQPLNIGPDAKRLFREGDFNIELPVASLNPGANTVVITAQSGGTEVTQNVTVNYQAGNTMPIPTTVDWSLLGGDIQSAAQIIDGQWKISGGKLVVDDPGYDRLVSLGDYNTWTDFEAEVPITIKSWNSSEWGSPSNGGGVGLMVHWRGHTQTGVDQQPREGWRRFGALAWFRIQQNMNTRFEMLGNGGSQMVARSDRQLELDKTYIFKISTQSSTFAGQPSHYRFKFWEQGQPEPVEWYLSTIGNSGEPATGSLVLVAHQAVVEYGKVSVKTLPPGPFTINKQNTSNGQIIIEPDKPSYSYGEQVQIRALGETGYRLGEWSGSFSGNMNPIDFEITQNVTVGATFVAAPTPPSLNISIIGQGSVNRSSQPPYLYGESLTLTPNPQQGYIFAGWSGDLSGANNPAVVVMDTSKNITANFVQASANSPTSDDFNSCALNTNLWTVVDPLNDGLVTVTGTELRLTVPTGQSHDIWANGNKSLRVMQPTQNLPFQIITKFDSVVTQRFQMQGILVEEDDKNFLRFEVQHDGTGLRLYVAGFTNGTPDVLIRGNYLQATPPYLRVTRVDEKWSYSYSTNGNVWTPAGSFSRAMNVTKTGVFASNHAFPAQTVPPHTAVVDYFFNSVAPIVPEDGNQVANFTLKVNTIGEGTVTQNPDKDFYQCNEQVNLTASPASGWRFNGWSGDLSGTSPNQQIVMTKNQQVTATFVRGTDPPPPLLPFRLYLPVVMR
jgi:large repetitive protein